MYLSSALYCYVAMRLRARRTFIFLCVFFLPTRKMKKNLKWRTQRNYILFCAAIYFASETNYSVYKRHFLTHRWPRFLKWCA